MWTVTIMTNVLKNGVIVMRVVNTVLLSVTTMMNVPKMTAIQALDVLMNLLSAKTITLVPLILAALIEDANTLK
jgi:hypothetical protein